MYSRSSADEVGVESYELFTQILSLWTMRWPRLTRVSEGYPYRRLLLGSNGQEVLEADAV